MRGRASSTPYRGSLFTKRRIASSIRSPALVLGEGSGAFGTTASSVTVIETVAGRNPNNDLMWSECALVAKERKRGDESWRFRKIRELNLILHRSSE